MTRGKPITTVLGPTHGAAFQCCTVLAMNLLLTATGLLKINLFLIEAFSNNRVTLRMGPAAKGRKPRRGSPLGRYGRRR